MCSAPAATCAVDVGQHDLARHDTELAVVNRDDAGNAGTECRQPRLASVYPATFARAIAHAQRGALVQRRKPSPIGRQKLKSWECRAGLRSAEICRAGLLDPPQRQSEGQA